MTNPTHPYQAYQRQLAQTRFTPTPPPQQYQSAMPVPPVNPARQTQPAHQPAPIPQAHPTSPPGPSQSRPKMRVHLPSGQDANLYSLIYTIEVLEDEFCNGYVSKEDRERLFPQLREQFKMICQALRLDRSHVTMFCEDVGLNCAYAMTALFDEIPQRDPVADADQQADGILLGTTFATLGDYCFMASGVAGDFYKLVAEIDRILRRYGVLERNAEVAAITKRWLDTFTSLPQTDIVPQEYIERLRGDLSIWRVSACDSLG